MKNNTFKIPATLPNPEGKDSLASLVFNDYPFHCQVFGAQNQESMLVLHGGPGGDFQYLLPLKELKDRYRVIFYDQRGTGLSPRVKPSSLSLEQYLEDVDAFVNYFSREGSLSIIGHSWGGYLALQYASRFPHKINKLVLAEPFIPDFRTRASLVWHNLRHGIIGKMIKYKIASLKVPATDAQAQKDYFFGQLLKQANPGYQCPGRDTTIPAKRAGFYAFRKLSGDSRGAKRLNDIQFPAEKVLMLVSECNSLLGKAYQERVAQKIGRPEQVEVPGAGHYMMQDNPEACLKFIREFMEKED